VTALAALGAIGRTPLLELPLPAGCRGRLLAKAEMLQPGGSVKDRTALGCIEQAIDTGELVPGQAVVEMTSGNMGAGLALVCGVLGHAFTAYMSAGNSPQRAAMIRRLGGDVVLVEQVDGAPGQVTGADIAAAEVAARDAAVRDGAYYVDQFNNPGGPRAHETGTASEVWDQTDGTIDAFVAVVGSGGTLIGTARGLKARRADVLCLAVEPHTAAVLADGVVTRPQHLLQGSGYGLVPPAFDRSVVDGYLRVTDDEAAATRAWLAQRCGLDVGFTAAANVRAATSWLQDQDADLTVVTVLCDTGAKYAT
jgi:cysteine synthase A